MELHQLRYFCAVADCGSFSRAAEQSHVSQPSLSQQILKLEDELGARLFDRLGRSVRLTDLGKTFLPRARAVLRELEAARGDVVERKDSIGGTICIGVIPTIAPYFLPAQLTFLSRRFLQARVTVVEEITPVLLERLRASVVDVAFVCGAAEGTSLCEAVVSCTEGSSRGAFSFAARWSLFSRHRGDRLRPRARPSANRFRERPVQQYFEYGGRGNGRVDRSGDGRGESSGLPLRANIRR